MARFMQHFFRPVRPLAACYFIMLFNQSCQKHTINCCSMEGGQKEVCCPLRRSATQLNISHYKLINSHRFTSTQNYTKMSVDLYKELNGVQTHLITWGNPFDSKGQDVIVCVTGNPGIPDFYKDFATELHERTGFPICVIGQAGHEEVPKKESNILKNQEQLFGLQGQVKHKLDLITNYIDKDSNLHLIGHSIGAWIVVELLQKDEKLLNRTKSANLLFPTIQRMAESENGVFLNNYTRKYHKLIIYLAMLLHLLPHFILKLLVDIYLKFNSLPSHYSEAVLKFVNPYAVEKVLFMAYEEMDMVTTLNKPAIERMKHVTNAIYSSRDGWVPTDYMEDLKPFQPPLQMKEVDINHSFVLKSSQRVAELVSEYIQSKITIN